MNVVLIFTALNGIKVMTFVPVIHAAVISARLARDVVLKLNLEHFQRLNNVVLL